MLHSLEMVNMEKKWQESEWILKFVNPIELYYGCINMLIKFQGPRRPPDIEKLRALNFFASPTRFRFPNIIYSSGIEMSQHV